MQPAALAEGPAGLAGVADQRGDRIAAREQAAAISLPIRPVAPITAVLIVSPSGKAPVSSRTCTAQ